MKNNKMKFSNVSLCFLVLLALLSMGMIIYVKALNYDIPPADETINSDWTGTLELNENKTVKIISIEHDNTETEYGAPIKICNGATVNLVFEGNNILTANPNIISAGIEVENGSTVNIYGLDGSNLTATGGKYSAGIGGAGYKDASINNPACGNINIYSGSIKAIGGKSGDHGGAGIGSGYHSSASDINIYGGNIIAWGSACGAGIGSGYGTSGGAISQGAGVGFYNGGNITISGGTIRAASFHMDFDNFDPYNTECLYGEGYSDSLAAGIGGGYGASSGNIIIEGDADVIALGACGGAGIGSGRGASNKDKYDSSKFDVNITIRGNAKVIAMATDDRRSSAKGDDDGGAAIGLGRGCTLENEPKGTVRIEGNAQVYAVAPDHAQAIGGSCAVGKFEESGGEIVKRPADAHLASISFGASTIVTAISDGYRDAIDHADGPELANFILINFSDDYFEEHGYFFTADKFPMKIKAIGIGSQEDEEEEEPEKEETFCAIQKPKKLCLMVHISDAEKYNFLVNDYLGENNEKIFISNIQEHNSSQFIPDPTAIKRYDTGGLTARLDRDSTFDSKYGKLKIKIRAKKGIFEYGSTFFCDKIADQSIIDDLNSKLDKEYSDKLERILYFDIGVKDRKGNNYNKIKGGKVRIYVEIPNGWDKDEVFALFVQSLDDESFRDTQKLVTIDGVTYVSFAINHFSDYALYDPVKKSKNKDNNKNDNEDEKNTDENDGKFLLTGDNIYIICTVLAVVMIISLFFTLTLTKTKGKRFRK